ncbi:MAG: CNNM domain-containing protein [Planctomycetota bacterium]|nr:CNNM domain-containing protein [Planctomycetota bacterium]
MSDFSDAAPFLVAMGILIFCSGFFSASEAAFFSLRARDRKILKNGTGSQQLVATLLTRPDRLLSAILFWNLVINVAYFALSSIVAIQLGSQQTLAASFAGLSLLSIIFFSEMLPKTFAVLKPVSFASWFSIPLFYLVRMIDPLMRFLDQINLFSQRLIWPSLEEEKYLEVSDLERAIDLSNQDHHIIEQERAILRNIVQLSDIRADEWMRPRSQFRSFHPPVQIAHLNGELPPSGYLLITEKDSEEIERAIRLRDRYEIPEQNLESLARPVAYAPWSTTVAHVYELMRKQDTEVVAIVNEFGETIGILTFEDVLDTVFNYEPSRAKRLLDQNPIHTIIPGSMWLISGMTSLRRLEEFVGQELPESQSVTVSGILQEAKQRIAQVNDACTWGPLQFRVLEMPHRGHMLIEMTRSSPEEKS